MTTSVDTNIFISVWDPDNEQNERAFEALEDALESGGVVVCAPVYAELLAGPGRDRQFLDQFFSKTGIRVDWEIREAAWRLAGEAYRSYSDRRKRKHDPGPRRILTDFLIGAHAEASGFHLLTLDTGIYRTAFPRLSVVAG